MNRTVCLLAAALLAGSGCQDVKVMTDRDPTVDFARYRTFGFAETEAKAGTVLASDINLERFKRAITQELGLRGYWPSESPDLMVHMDVSTAGRTKTFRSRSNRSYSTNLPQNQTVHYTEGTLVVDLVDTQKNKQVWQGVAEGLLREHTRNLDSRIHDVVKRVFRTFPPTTKAAPAAP